MTVSRDCRVMRNIGVPMRDGVELATTVFLPASGDSFPVILVRTAYWRTNHWSQGVSFARNGYAFVVQDCRGRYDSPGEHYPFVTEGEDGYDTLEWIAQQPWCNGKVGMFGASYLAATQYYLALEGSPYLKSLIPMFMTGDPWQRAYYSGGAFSLALNLIWLCFEVCSRTSESALMNLFDMEKLFRKLPLLTLDEASGYDYIPYWRDYVRHWTYDDYWKSLSIRDNYADFTMPMLFIGGWYDYYAAETFTNFLGVRQHSPREVRHRHRLVIGPWGHGWTGSSKMGHVDFGPQSLVNGDQVFLDWFDETLRDKELDTEATPIRYFVMGANEWRSATEWPLPGTQFTNYYLHSSGSANSLYGNGVLSAKPPADEPADDYTYNPENPMPTLGGNHSVGLFWESVRSVIQPGPFDQRPIERRDDMLVYTTAPLEEGIEVTGPIALKLYAASSAPDTDFVARLCDVHPDGRSINLTEGVLRARFRERVWDQPRLIEPGEVYEYTIDLQVTSNVFKQGHRLRLDVTSSCFPLWDRNPNTGHEPGLDAEMQAARQTAYHNQAYPSHLVLPVVTRS
ncbi:MAG: CocE/NonD family hydrolase [Armatimonadetes bacterium]|nr:CocE/NonD family hydrolase [Armatimonadota bacterium]